MRPRWLPLLLAVPLAGCATTTGNGPGGDNGWPGGRTFLSTGVTEGGTAKSLVSGTRISLAFDDEGGQLSANAGCNHLMGAASIAGGKLIVTQLGSTEMGCDPDRSAQDTWLSGVLEAKPSLTVKGDTLVLTSDDVTIELVDRAVADPDRPVVGTEWVVDTILSGDAASSIPGGARATLQITSAGTFQATTGCTGGAVTGSASVHDGRVSFTDVTATPCTGGPDALDSAVRATLAGEVTYTVVARRLTLTGPSGDGLGLGATP